MNSRIFLLLSALFLLANDAVLGHPKTGLVKRDVFDLNQCFTYRKGFRIELKAGDIESTDTVQFKDDCLKACLKALLNDGFECRSLMHMPRENDCVLTTVEGNSANIVRLSEEKGAAPINYYENECAKLPLPGGGVVEAKLQGYRGQGLVQMMQKKGTNPQIMVILNGVQENNNFDIVYIDEEVKDCYKLTQQQKSSAQILVTVDSDTNGMGVQPWTEIFFDLLVNPVLGKTVAVIDAKTKQVFDCGKIQIRGNAADFERAKNGGLTMVPAAFLVAITGIAMLL